MTASDFAQEACFDLHERDSFLRPDQNLKLGIGFAKESAPASTKRPAKTNVGPILKWLMKLSTLKVVVPQFRKKLVPVVNYRPIYK